MSDEDEEDFVTFGTALPEYEDGKTFFTNLGSHRAVEIAFLVDLKHDSTDKILKKFG